MSIHVRHDVFHHFPEGGKTDEILDLLRDIKSQGAKIMATEAELLAVVKEIDDATTEQGVALGAMGESLLNVSADIDRLVAGGVTPETLAALTATSAKVKATGENLKAQAEFSKALAAKVEDPVPPPPPPPPPG